MKHKFINWLKRIRMWLLLRAYFRRHTIHQFKQMMVGAGYNEIRSGTTSIYHFPTGGSVILTPNPTGDIWELELITKK